MKCSVKGLRTSEQSWQSATKQAADVARVNFASRKPFRTNSVNYFTSLAVSLPNLPSG